MSSLFTDKNQNTANPERNKENLKALSEYTIKKN